jgi:hypothetical protein
MADRAFYERLGNRTADVAPVESVALATDSGIPPRSGERSVVDVPGRDMRGEAPILQRISGHCFATMKIALVRGRVWSDSESAGAPHVAVVNQTMARELWPDESAIGRRIRMPEYIKSPAYFRLAAPGSDGWFEIVGVVDPVVLVAVSLVLFVVTMMSAAIPTHRAVSIQPADALRID